MPRHRSPDRIAARAALARQVDRAEPADPEPAREREPQRPRRPKPRVHVSGVERAREAAGELDRGGSEQAASFARVAGRLRSAGVPARVERDARGGAKLTVPPDHVERAREAAGEILGGDR